MNTDARPFRGSGGRRARVVGALTLAAGLLAGHSASAQVDAVIPPSSPLVSPDTVLVRLRPTALAAEAARGPGSAHAMAGALEIVHQFSSVPGLALVRVPEGRVDGALTAYRFHPDVLYAEANPIRFAMAQSTPYGVSNIGAPAAWGAARGGGVRVSINDTGIAAHPDLPAPIAAESFMPGETVDDGYSHGTHVAGTVLALDNDQGVVGVAPAASLLVAKVLSSGGSGDTANIMAGAEWAAQRGAQVINMSLGGGDYLEAERDLYAALAARNVLVVASAGNSSSDEPTYPAWYEAVVNVVAVDSANNRASFSNYGLRAELAGPGVFVESTIPTYWQTAYFANAGRGAARMTGTGLGSASGLVVNCGVGRPQDFPAKVAGNIAHIRRGPDPSTNQAITFQTKYNNAVAAGAVGVIISNNAGGLGSFTAGNNVAPIPCVFVSQSDGDAAIANPDQPGTINVYISGSTYSQYSGTSMAAPHVSGAAALVLAAMQPVAVPVADLRQALRDSATDLGTPGWDQYYGYGLVNPAGATALLRQRLCPADYNRDGAFNLDDLADFITDFYIVPAIPGGWQPDAPSYAGAVMGFSVPCPDAPDAPWPYAADAYRLWGYRAGYASDASGLCPPSGLTLDSLGDFITLYYTEPCR